MIPKIIHQIWIGDNNEPTKFMNTWKNKNPGFEYIKWNEEELKNRNIILECANRVNEIEEMCGKADIIRWELLYKYGGIFLDADSICIEPIDDELMKNKSFLVWENEQVRKDLLAVGIMAFPPNHDIPKRAIEHIKKNEVSKLKTWKRPWQNTGPVLLTNLYNSGNYKDVTILPSYSFLPIHYTGIQYDGHGKVYSYQEWGSSKNNYDIMNDIKLPSQFLEPDDSVSILISSYNTKAQYLKECLESIKHQCGYIKLEIIWINDGSDELHTSILKKILDYFKNTTRFIDLIYIENEVNKGLGYSLNKGVNLAKNNIILRMDSDDLMYGERVMLQYEYMKKNQNCVLCGAQINMFKIGNNGIEIIGQTNHKDMDLDTFKTSMSQWFINHPTFCFRKDKILEIGNYNNSLHSMCEDYELVLRVLKKYKKVNNMDDVLLYYRIHDKQLTHNGGKEGREYWNEYRKNLISKIIEI